MMSSPAGPACSVTDDDDDTQASITSLAPYTMYRRRASNNENPRRYCTDLAFACVSIGSVH